MDNKMPPLLKNDLKDGGHVEHINEIDLLLDNPSFLQFLARASEVGTEEIDMGDIDTIKAKFKIFETQGRVKEGLRKVCSEQIKKDLGLNLDESELKSIDSYIENIAFSDAKKLDVLDHQITTFSENANKISELETKISEIGEINVLENKLDDDLKNGDSLLKMRDRLGIFGEMKSLTKSGMYFGKSIFFGSYKNALITFSRYFPQTISYEKIHFQDIRQNEAQEEFEENERYRKSLSAKTKDAVDYIKNKYGNINHYEVHKLITETDNKIQDSLGTIKTLDSIENELTRVRSEFVVVRKELFQNFSNIRGLKDVIQGKVKNQLRVLTEKNDKTLSDMEEAKRIFVEYRDRFKVHPDTGIDPLAAVDDQEFINTINADSDLVIHKEIQQKLSEIDINSQGAFARFEEAIINHLNATNIGFVEDIDIVKEKLITTLNTLRQNVGEKTAKGILLARLISKVRNNQYTKS